MLRLPGMFPPPGRALTPFVPLSSDTGYVSLDNAAHPVQSLPTSLGPRVSSWKVLIDSPEKQRQSVASGQFPLCCSQRNPCSLAFTSQPCPGSPESLL